MRKIVSLLMLVAVLLLTACGQSAGGTESSSEDKVIKIGATPDGYPLYYMEDSEIKGFVVEVMETIIENAGYETEWVLSDWSGVLASLETGKIDTAAGFALTPERAEKYDYTEPYYYSRVGIGVSKENDTINTLEDLKGKQAANILGSNYGEVLKENDSNNEIEVINYEGPEVVYQDVASGKIDAFVTGREMLLVQVKDKEIPLKVAEEAFGEKPVAMPFVKNEENKKRIEELNQSHEELKADGTIKELSEKWFGEDVTVSVEE
ncbi:transporter substrate-binding domain-containing protein [Oceanobacillus damuensis]|uniref:transporter substrate-binding domain-containing protein n=1 Tax=Oceanobacillus damuensis TaxID=937928 RepID=UPI00082C1154|nr:transporter substrate-binding domain-containing protein [Oceanobacillus damuensis]